MIRCSSYDKYSFYFLTICISNIENILKNQVRTRVLTIVKYGVKTLSQNNLKLKVHIVLQSLTLQVTSYI